MPATSNPRLMRSVVAVIVGAFVGIVLSIGTDLLLRAGGILPAPDQAASSPVLLLATVYRTVYGILGSYITARLAAFRPMAHAMVLGLMGLVANILGTVTTWNKGPAFGPHWYPITLIVLALPTAWAGAQIRIAQLRKAAASL
jgi:uncharacterized membrane protein